MIHFPAEQWFEFERDSVPPEQRLQMQRHLEDGCDACRKFLSMWREILEIGARESSYRPPGEAVRSALAAFAPSDRWKWFPEIAHTARLIFDSMLEPVPAEIRGSAMPTRQFLQESKPFSVDVRVETEPTSKRVRLIGQVLNSAEPQKNVSDVEIFVLKGEQLAANTKANAYGEFELEFADEENIQLFVDIRGRKVIEILLPSLSAGAKD